MPSIWYPHCGLAKIRSIYPSAALEYPTRIMCFRFMPLERMSLRTIRIKLRSHRVRKKLIPVNMKISLLEKLFSLMMNSTKINPSSPTMFARNRLPASSMRPDTLLGLYR